MLSGFGLVLVLPPYLESAAYVPSENLAEAALVTAFTTMVLSILHRRRGWMIISAFFIGYAGLTRLTYQVLAIAIAGYIIVAKLLFDRWVPLNWTVIVRATAILICGSIVLVGGYSFINYRCFWVFWRNASAWANSHHKNVAIYRTTPG